MTLFSRLLSENDPTILHAVWNNKSASVAAIIWTILYRKQNVPNWILELLADYIVIHDGKDVGLFDRLHHWQTGYIMKILSRTKGLSDRKRKSEILKGLTTMLNSKKRSDFLRGRR